MALNRVFAVQNVTDFNGDFVRSVPLDEPMIEVDGRQFWRLSCRGSTEMWFDLWTNWPMTKYAHASHACISRSLLT